VQTVNIALAALPVVSTLHLFSVDYGYRGLSKDEAWRRARGVLLLTAVPCWLVLLLRISLEFFVTGHVAI
jgi:hypothetical protein